MKDLAIDDLQLFARVAALGSLSAVARERDAPASQVSRALAHIEKICGARLIHRSTHGLSLTPECGTLLVYCQRISGLVRDGIDIAIRSATHFPGTVVVRQIGALGRALYASPSARHRLPKIKACLDYWAQWFDASARASANGFKA